LQHSKNVKGKSEISNDDIIKKIGLEVLENIKVRINDSSKEKLSNIILEFAHHFTKEIKDDKLYRLMIVISILGWNFAVSKKDDWKSMIDYKFDEDSDLPISKDDYLKMIETMIELKNKLYPNINRCVIDYKLSVQNCQPQLEVVSLDLDENKVNQSGLL